MMAEVELSASLVRSALEDLELFLSLLKPKPGILLDLLGEDVQIIDEMM